VHGDIDIKLAKKNDRLLSKQDYHGLFLKEGCGTMQHDGLPKEAVVTMATIGHSISSGMGRMKRTLMKNPKIVRALFKDGHLREEPIRDKRPDGSDYTNKSNWSMCWHIVGNSSIRKINISYDFTVFKHKDNKDVEVYDFDVHGK